MASSSEPRRRRWGAAAVALVAASLLLVAAAWVVPLPARLALPGSPVVRYRDGSVAHVFLAPDDRWRVAASPDRVDPAYLAALVAFEDARFWWHPGVDPVAVGRAVVQNVSAGRVVSGASTLTMQLVRLAEPRPRTLRSKVVEAFRAAQLELRWSKTEILAGYLALAPYGRNLEGVESASWAAFGHGAQALTAGEIATLLAIPQNPTARHPSPANQARLTAARDDIAGRLLEAGALPVPAGQTAAEVLAQVVASPAPSSLRPLPRDLPHAARWMRSQGAGADVTTTLDRGTQALVQRELTARAATAATQGIQHAAVVVVDWESGDVRALAGSFDFWSETPGSQIPAFAVPRSPGSTLKPFVYAAAIEQGLALPEFLVPDVPVRYGTYAPDNYDGGFDGLVRMEDALSRSLNVPFVELAGQLGVEPLLGRLRSLGVRSLDPRPGHYGLSLVVGGVELTPLELAGMYATLARGGQSRSLRWRSDAPTDDGRRAIAPGAAWLTRRALRLRDRPDFPSRAQLAAVPTDIHWKTGTSFGHRDAWAVGSGKRHTVAVWLGNLDNQTSRHLVGADAAGPILFDLLEGLGDGHGRDIDPPTDLKQVQICSLSGHLAGAACPRARPAFALSAAVPPERCPYHRAVEVDVATGLQVGPGCRAGLDTRHEVVVEWPPAVRRWLAEGHRALPGPPAVAAGCQTVGGGRPRIVSPDPGTVALLIPGVDPAEQEIPLEAAHTRSEGRLDWFVDGVHVGATGPDERLWWVPTAGAHEVLVQDQAGRSDRLRFSVRGG